jgi:hypothetical protein
MTARTAGACFFLGLASFATGKSVAQEVLPRIADPAVLAIEMAKALVAGNRVRATALSATRQEMELLLGTHQPPATPEDRQERRHIREGKHGAKSAKQVMAIGLSKARRAGVKLQAPREGTTSQKTRRQAVRESTNAKSSRKPSRKRSAATEAALKREAHSAASKKALSAQARSAARRRSASARHQSAMKAVGTKRKESRMASSQKTARARRAS